MDNGSGAPVLPTFQFSCSGQYSRTFTDTVIPSNSYSYQMNWSASGTGVALPETMGACNGWASLINGCGTITRTGDGAFTDSVNLTNISCWAASQGVAGGDLYFAAISRASTGAAIANWRAICPTTASGLIASFGPTVNWASVTTAGGAFDCSNCGASTGGSVSVTRTDTYTGGFGFGSGSGTSTSTWSWSPITNCGALGALRAAQGCAGCGSSGGGGGGGGGVGGAII